MKTLTIESNTMNKITVDFAPDDSLQVVKDALVRAAHEEIDNFKHYLSQMNRSFHYSSDSEKSQDVSEILDQEEIADSYQYIIDHINDEAYEITTLVDIEEFLSETFDEDITIS